MKTKDRLVTEAFRAAGRDLGIDVVAPFDVVVDGRGHHFLAFLPHFGGPQGMVVAEMPTDGALYAAARKAGLYISFINADAYDSYNRKHFIETLADWSYYGPEEKRPAWLKANTDGN